MHACILGAGVIGVTTAWQLAQAGWQVTLVDAAAEAAAGTSFANGGQLSYRYVAPLAEPGVLLDIPRWLFNPRSPLRFRPRLDPQQWRWCLQFLRACNAGTAARTTQALLALADLSRESLATLLAQAPVAFAHRTNGKLIVYRSARLLDQASAGIPGTPDAGFPQQRVDADACVALEPALAPVRHAIAGAIYTPSEEVGDCHAFTEGLFRQLAARPGVTLRMRTGVARLARQAGRIQHITTTQGEILAADHFVVCAGMGSQQLLAPLGANPGLYPLVGYSLSVPQAGASGPGISVTDYERRTVYARLDSTLRIAAMVGLGVRSDRVDPGRIDLLKRQVGELLPQLDLSGAASWVGARPATATGLPLIGRTRLAPNLWLNTGHGALGFTLACGSAALLGTLMQDAGEPALDPAPFQPAF